MSFCHGPDGAEAHAGRTRPLTGEELPVLLPRLPVKLLSMVMVRTPYSRELFIRMNFSPPVMRPQASTPFSQQIGEHDAQGAVIQIFVLRGDRQPGGKGNALPLTAGGVVGHHPR